MKIIVRWLLLAAALLLVANLYGGRVRGQLSTALWAALVLGLLNTLVRPLLVLLTLPVTLITLGLFLFVINALDVLGRGFACWTASTWRLRRGLIGSLLYSLCGMVIDVAIERLFSRSAP
jgi:putative membrane protein